MSFKTYGSSLRFTTPNILDHYAAGVTLVTGQWQHVAVTFDAGQANGVRFYLNGNLVSQIARMHPANKAMQQAKAYIACIINTNPEAIYEGFEFQVEDCAAAVENMLLAITALGYASVWIDGWLRVDNRSRQIGNMLNIPAEKVVRILLPIGVPAKEVRGPKKMDFGKRAFINKYGQ